MKFQKTMSLIISLICITLLIASYLLWKDKLEKLQNESKTELNTQLKTTAPENETVEQSEEIGLSREDLVKTIHNMDEQAQRVILDRYDNKEKVQLLIVGSAVMGEGNPGYAQQLSDALTNTYSSLFETTLSPWDVTSDVFIESHLEELGWETGYDLILLEPFTLNNNGKVTIEDEHDHIKAVQEKAREHVEDSLVILQPTNPFYQAQFYLVQIQALERFAINNKIPYINHWTDWPATDEVALTEFVTEDNHPNNDGANLWSSILISYFTSQ